MEKAFLFSNLSMLKIQKPQVAFAFLVGSRAWKTHTSKSDTDMIVITHAENAIPTSTHTQTCDFTILTMNQFLDRLSQGSFLETLGLFMIPDNCYVDEKFEGRLRDTKKGIKNLESVKRWVQERNAKDFAKADKFAEKGKYRDA
ncbi:UNVERIFIED_CONTAM: hypothetical protein HDU68_000841, partial [Siphonaria sp. JEL0065]